MLKKKHIKKHIQLCTENWECLLVFTQEKHIICVDGPRLLSMIEL